MVGRVNAYKKKVNILVNPAFVVVANTNGDEHMDSGILLAVKTLSIPSKELV